MKTESSSPRTSRARISALRRVTLPGLHRRATCPQSRTGDVPEGIQGQAWLRGRYVRFGSHLGCARNRRAGQDRSGCLVGDAPNDEAGTRKHQPGQQGTCFCGARVLKASRTRRGRTAGLPGALRSPCVAFGSYHRDGPESTFLLTDVARHASTQDTNDFGIPGTPAQKLTPQNATKYSCSWLLVSRVCPLPCYW